jgi:hypothetical protein
LFCGWRKFGRDSKFQDYNGGNSNLLKVTF